MEEDTYMKDYFAFDKQFVIDILYHDTESNQQRIRRFIKDQFVIFYIEEIKTLNKSFDGIANTILLIKTCTNFTIRKKNLFDLEDISILVRNLTTKNYNNMFQDLIILGYDQTKYR